MQTTFALLSVALAAAGASAQGVAAGTLLPSTSTPSTCSENYSGKFEITVVKAGASKRQSSSCSSSDVLVAQLSGGILTDAKGRIGGIVANHQFQFDGPPSQTGTLINGGWSVCNNGSLALGASSVFYQCLSGDFYNLYDESTGAQCQQVLIDIIPCSSSSSASVASQVSDGQVTAASAATQISDGQIQASSAATVVSQITDGQIQAQSAAYQPVSQISDGQIQATAMATATPVKQITDGQIQATTAAANTATPVKQITDGQIQATTAAVVSQISDGQIQATAAATLKTTASPVAQISDGQIQASNATAKATTAATYTGGAALPTFAAGAFAAVAAVGAALL